MNVLLCHSLPVYECKIGFDVLLFFHQSQNRAVLLSFKESSFELAIGGLLYESTFVHKIEVLCLNLKKIPDIFATSEDCIHARTV